MGPSNGQHQGKDYHRSHASIANRKYNTMAKTNNPNRFMAEQTATTNAWFVLAALGLYAAAPGTEEYVMGSPIFRHVKVS